MDLESLLVSAPWLAVVVWSIAYVADYYLTIAGARLYAHGAKDHVVYEGSYELNPTFVADINALRLVSRRFIAGLVLSSILIAASAYAAQQYPDYASIYLFVYGSLLFVELATLERHAVSIAALRRVKAHQGVAGQVIYARWFLLETSSLSMFVKAAFLAAAALVTWDAMLFGGVFGLLVVGQRQASLSRQHRRLAADASKPSPNAPSQA